MNEAIVDVSGVSKSFGAVKALDEVSLSIEPGSIYALLGPNGAGKTTLIRVLATLLRPDSGTATVAGVDVLDNPVGARTHIGLAGQYAALDEYLTGMENLEIIGRLFNLSKKQARQRAGEVLEGIHLTDAADRTVRTYSGGMRRRLDLAASLVGHPDVLFLDEPTTGVDPRSRMDLWALIGELVEGGTTLLLTTQYLEEADRLADRIGVIDVGTLLAEGTADQLKDKFGGAVVELAVAPELRGETTAALRAVAGDLPTLDHDTGRLTIPAPDGARTLMAAARRIDEAGITPDDIGLRKPTLDDVFLSLTGHAATTIEESPNGGGRRRARRHS